MPLEQGTLQGSDGFDLLVALAAELIERLEDSPRYALRLNGVPQAQPQLSLAFHPCLT